MAPFQTIILGQWPAGSISKFYVLTQRLPGCWLDGMIRGAKAPMHQVLPGIVVTGARKQVIWRRLRGDCDDDIVAAAAAAARSISLGHAVSELAYRWRMQKTGFLPER
ncbi:hypothetical protein CGRA01v4_07868 [Colletotrichum graminicola]|nr:hypothetical protein CGRA01v4_07868 [Colletotrichum graminicola]